MCGIFAYVNYNVCRERRCILEVLFNGLRRLEYRGYDSSGIAIDSDPLPAAAADHCENGNGNGPHGAMPFASPPPLVFRQEGKIESLVRSVYSEVDSMDLNLEKSFSLHAGIAHTRWATHGVPAPRNSHPQSSGAWNEFLVVHNGIITNYEVLKETLTRHGFTFESETDTEVIPKLAKFVFDKAREGIRRNEKNRGVREVNDVDGEDLRILSSSNSDDGDGDGGDDNNESNKDAYGGTYADGCVSILKFDYDKEKPASIERVLSFLEMEVEQIKKGNYDHFMQKEIHEQPHSLTTTMRGRLLDNDVFLGGLKVHMKTIRHSRRIVFIGCGTSYIAAIAVRPFLEELSGIPVTMELASDLLDRQGPIYREDTAVFVSQSGETADTLLALDYAFENGAFCVGVTNTVGSTLARKTHCGVHINAGCEIGVASTKAYTSQIVAISMMTLAIGDDRISTKLKREEIINELSDLPNKVREVLELDAEMKNIAESLIDVQSLLVFGRGYNYATAMEGALKVKEVALMHSEGMLAGEMKHGPLALVDENLPIIVIATRDACFSKQQSVIQQLHARKARLIVMCSKGDSLSVCLGGSSRAIEVPQVVDCLQTVVNIIPLQLLAYHLTVLRGYDVDQPLNLAKSVTTQ